MPVAKDETLCPKGNLELQTSNLKQTRYQPKWGSEKIFPKFDITI